MHCILNRIAGFTISGGLTKWITVLSAIPLALAAAFLVLIKFCEPVGQDFGPMGGFAKFMYTHRFLIVCVLLSVQLVFQVLTFVSRWLQGFDAEKVKTVLDNLVEAYFPERDLARHYYRATLFRVKKFKPFGKWLGIVARSGLLYTRFGTVFSIDHDKKENNTGFAGECWRREGQTIEGGIVLPDQREQPPTAEQLEEYKMRGWLADVEYDVMSVKAVVLSATGIRVKGKIWGILVLDSTDTSAYLPDESKAHLRVDRRRALESSATSLTLLLS